MTTPNYPPAEPNEWGLALCHRIINERGAILEKNLREAFIEAYSDAVLRGEV